MNDNTADLDKTPGPELSSDQENKKRVSVTLSGATLAAFSKRLEGETDLSADRLASLLITQSLGAALPEPPVASELKVLTAQLKGLQEMAASLPEAQGKAYQLALGPIALKVDTVRQCLTDLASKPLGPAELAPDQLQLLKGLTEDVKLLHTYTSNLSSNARPRDLRLTIVSIILIGLAGWAAFRPAPAKVDLTLQGELRALRQTVEARPDLGPKVAELAKRIDVQDKAFVAVMDRLQPPKKP